MSLESEDIKQIKNKEDLIDALSMIWEDTVKYHFLDNYQEIGNDLHKIIRKLEA